MKLRIGIFGVGKMGYPIACNLFDDGHDVIGFDITEQARKRLHEKKIRVADTPREVMENADVIFSALNECSQLATMMDGPDGLLAGYRPNGRSSAKVIFDLSTSDPEDSVPLGESFIEKGIEYLDCAMTGGKVGAENRQLVFMAGGNKTIFDKYTPLLDRLAKSINFLGPLGCGHTMKLLHNAVSNSTFNVVIEATALGRMYDMDLQAMIDVFNVGNARSYATEVRFPKYIISGTFDQGYTFNTGVKDFTMILKTAERKSFRMPMSEETYNYWTYAKEMGLGEEDVTMLYNLINEKNAKK